MTAPDPMQPPAELAPDATVTPTPTEARQDARPRVTARVFCCNWSATEDFVPHAGVLIYRDGELAGDTFFPRWVDAIAWVDALVHGRRPTYAAVAR